MFFVNPVQIKEILKELGGGANKRLGQHFLIDPSVLRIIVEAADIHASDRVLEIGPGLGVLTRALCEAGASVTAIERDLRYVKYLQAKSGSAFQYSVVHGDAVNLNWSSFVGDEPWKFISNLPYGITSFALRKALWASVPPTNIVVLVQREVAERAIARNGKSSLLFLMVALSSSEYRIIKRVPAGAFFPPPNVESAILQIVPMSWNERETRWGVHPDRIMELAKRGFAHPRKQLASNLGLAAEEKTFLGELTGSERVRAEDLSPDQWAILVKRLKSDQNDRVQTP